MTPEKRYPLTLLLSLIVVMLVFLLMAFYIGIKIGYEAGANRLAVAKIDSFPATDTTVLFTPFVRKCASDSIYAVRVYSLKCPDSSFSQKNTKAMKELNILDAAQERTEVQRKKQQEKQTILDGVLKPQRGHKVWEIDTATGEIKEANYKVSSVDYAAFVRGDKSVHRDLIKNDGCIYIPALNKANASKKYADNPQQSAYYLKEAPMQLGY